MDLGTKLLFYSLCGLGIWAAVRQAMKKTPTLRTTSRSEYQGTIDFVSSREYSFTRHAVSKLEEARLYPRLTRELQTDEDYANPKKWPFLFEARFAYELLRAGVNATYEYSTGVQGGCVDFRFYSGQEWLVELVSPQVSDATLRQTQIADHPWGKTFSQTPDAGIEATRLVDKIIEKGG